MLTQSVLRRPWPDSERAGKAAVPARRRPAQASRGDDDTCTADRGRCHRLVFDPDGKPTKHWLVLRDFRTLRRPDRRLSPVDSRQGQSL